MGRGETYDQPFLERERAGQDVHGEARLVASWGPLTVLDAGCGTGRVAIELARRGISVTGVDADPEMLATARWKAPGLEWILGDLSRLELVGADGALRRFDLCVLAGNVMTFVEPGTEPAVLDRISRHLVPRGRVVAGFQLRAGDYDLAAHDAGAAAAGLALEARWAGWAREPWVPSGTYAVSVHRRSR